MREECVGNASVSTSRGMGEGGRSNDFREIKPVASRDRVMALPTPPASRIAFDMRESRPHRGHPPPFPLTRDRTRAEGDVAEGRAALMSRVTAEFQLAGFSRAGKFEEEGGGRSPRIARRRQGVLWRNFSRPFRLLNLFLTSRRAISFKARRRSRWTARIEFYTPIDIRQSRHRRGMGRGGGGGGGE